MTEVPESFASIKGITEAGSSRQVSAGGTMLHYHECGAGPALVMLHSGGPGTTAWLTFYKVLPALSRHFRCLALDLPNFGRSGPLVFNEPEHVFYARIARDFMDALGIRQAYLLGNSDGGEAAMVFAYTYPERVQKLVFGAGHIGTADGYVAEYTFTVEPEGSRESLRAAKDDASPENLRRYLEWYLYDRGLITDDLIRYLSDVHTGRPDLVDARARSVSLPSEHTEGIMGIAAPTLLVWGRHDRAANHEIGINALNHIPNARLVVLHCGHWPPFELPHEYTSHVLNFLLGDWA